MLVRKYQEQLIGMWENFLEEMSQLSITFQVGQNLQQKIDAIQELEELVIKEYEGEISMMSSNDSELLQKVQEVTDICQTQTVEIADLKKENQKLAKHSVVFEENRLLKERCTILENSNARMQEERLSGIEELRQKELGISQREERLAKDREKHEQEVKEFIRFKEKNDKTWTDILHDKLAYLTTQFSWQSSEKDKEIESREMLIASLIIACMFAIVTILMRDNYFWTDGAKLVDYWNGTRHHILFNIVNGNVKQVLNVVLITVQVVIAVGTAGSWGFLLWKKKHWAETGIAFVMAVLFSCMVKAFLIAEKTNVNSVTMLLVIVAVYTVLRSIKVIKHMIFCRWWKKNKNE